MSAEGLLHNPALFTPLHRPIWSMAQEYLELVLKHPCPLSFTRGHMFKLFHHCILVEENEDIRTIIAKAQTIEEFTKAVDLLRSRYAQEECQELDVCTFPLPFYLCQPYFRPPPAEERQQQAKRSASDENEAENGRLFADAANLLEGEAISKKKAKKIKRRANKDDEGKKKEPFQPSIVRTMSKSAGTQMQPSDVQVLLQDCLLRKNFGLCKSQVHVSEEEAAAIRGTIETRT